MFHFDQIINLSFWFTPRPGEAGVYFARSAILYGFLFLAALLLYLFVTKIRRKDVNPVHAKFWRKVYTCLFTISIIGGLLVLFRVEKIAYLSLRFLVLLLFLGFIIWMIVILKYYLTVYQKELTEYQEIQRKQKYLK